jgi:hypothetical protein
MDCLASHIPMVRAAAGRTLRFENQLVLTTLQHHSPAKALELVNVAHHVAHQCCTRPFGMWRQFARCFWPPRLRPETDRLVCYRRPARRCRVRLSGQTPGGKRTIALTPHLKGHKLGASDGSLAAANPTSRAHPSPIAPCSMSSMTKRILKRLEGFDG